MVKFKLRNSLAILCLLPGLSANAATTLKIATLAPDSTTWMQEMRAGAREIEELTAGRVKIKFYPGGVMGNDSTVMRKIRIGQLHGGAVTAGAVAEIYPDAQIYSLPMQFRSLDELSFVRQHMDELIRQGLEKKGFVNIGISNGGFAYLAGHEAVTDISDLKALRVWIPQGDMIGETMFKAAGISPVPLPLSDVYTSLQTGLLDTVIGTPSSIIAFQWHTKVKNITDAPLVFLIGMLIVDKRVFNRLSADDQRVVRQVMIDKFTALDELNKKDNENARKALAANGIQFVIPTEQERQSWLNIANSSLQKLAQRGAYSESFLNMLQEHLSIYRKQKQTE